jgi:hypothetical protein
MEAQKKVQHFRIFFACKNGFAPKNGSTIKNDVSSYLRHSLAVFELHTVKSSIDPKVYVFTMRRSLF